MSRTVPHVGFLPFSGVCLWAVAAARGRGGKLKQGPYNGDLGHQSDVGEFVQIRFVTWSSQHMAWQLSSRQGYDDRLSPVREARLEARSDLIIVFQVDPSYRGSSV